MKFKGTKGKAVVSEDGMEVFAGGNFIANFSSGWPEDAKLFSNALNTTNECGMMPSELLQSNKELLEALEVLYKHTKQWTDQGSYSEQEAFELELNQAQQAIKNAKS